VKATTRPAMPLKRVALLLTLLPILGGCWDRLELEERAVVLGISIDAAAQEEVQALEDEVSHLKGNFPTPGTKPIRLAVQIALPGRIPLGPGEGGGGSNNNQTIWVVDVVGHTIDDAIMNLQQQISGRLFFGHLRVIVVSEEIARSGLQNLNDYMRRNSEVRRMAWLMIARGNAKALLDARPKLERVPTLFMISTLDDAVKLGKFPMDYIGIYWSNSSKKGQEGYLPYVQLMSQQNIELKGLAYFKGDKMAGATKPLEIGAFMGVKGMNPAGYRGSISIDNTGNSVMLYSTHRQSKIDVAIENGRPHFHVVIANELNLEEKSSESFLVDRPEILADLEKKDEEAANKFHAELIKKTQENGSDIFGFGEHLRAKKPRYWDREVKTKEQWQKMYKDIPIDVTVDIKIRRIGMKAR